MRNTSSANKIIEPATEHNNAFDPRDLSLPFIAENLASASCFAASGASFANAGDMKGLAYAVQKTLAHMKAAAGATRDLLGQTLPNAEREASNG